MFNLVAMLADGNNHTPSPCTQADEIPRLTEELATPLKMMQDSARRIARVAVEAKLPLEEDKYVEKFRPHLMDVVHAWATVYANQ